MVFVMRIIMSLFQEIGDRPFLKAMLAGDPWQGSKPFLETTLFFFSNKYLFIQLSLVIGILSNVQTD